MNFDFTEILNSIIEENVMFLPGCRKVGKNYNFRCIYCHDSKTSLKKKRGWVYTDPIKGHSYHCYNAGCPCPNNRGIELVADIISSDISEVNSIIANRLKDRNSIGVKDLSEIEPSIDTAISKNNVNESEFILPENWVSLTKDCETVLEGRRILEAPYKPDNMKYYYCNKSKRLVIPWYEYNHIVTYQTRALYNYQTPKYVFQSDSTKGIFGKSKLDYSVPYIFTHEGVFDSIFMINSVAVGGISPTINQTEILNTELPSHEIVYVTDNPWQDKSSREFIIKLADKKPNQLVYLWDINNKYKDINEEVVSIGNINKYTDLSIIEKNIFTASKIKLSLLFNKMPI